MNQSALYGDKTPLRLPEYGRLIQRMVDIAVKMPVKQDRQTYATLIVRLMKAVSEGQKGDLNLEKKLWDHLAYISNYQLDIDWPHPIVHQGEKSDPPKITYEKKRIKMRRYGMLAEKMLEKVSLMPESPEREELVRLIATRMKRNSAEELHANDSDERIAHDIALLTEERITPDFSERHLSDYKVSKKQKKS